MSILSFTSTHYSFIRDLKDAQYDIKMNSLENIYSLREDAIDPAMKPELITITTGSVEVMDKDSEVLKLNELKNRYLETLHNALVFLGSFRSIGDKLEQLKAASESNKINKEWLDKTGFDFQTITMGGGNSVEEFFKIIDNPKFYQDTINNALKTEYEEIVKYYNEIRDFVFDKSDLVGSITKLGNLANLVFSNVISMAQYVDTVKKFSGVVDMLIGISKEDTHNV